MKEVKVKVKVINQKLKGISTIIGSIIANIIIGNSLIWLYLPEKADYYFEDKSKSKALIVSLILTFSNFTKLCFSFYTKYQNIRIYLVFSFLFLILSHSLLYMFNIKSISIISFILYGIGIGIPFHQIVINSSLHFINKKPLILLINKISYNISPLLYYFFFANTETISPNGTEIIIFYLVCAIIASSMSFDYIRECLIDKNDSNEQSLLIKNELEYSITDITANTDRISEQSETSINLNKKNKNFFPGENDNVRGVFLSKRQSIIAVLKDKNIYFILVFFFLSIFLTVEKINKINIDEIYLFYITTFVSRVLLYLIFEKITMPSIILKLSPVILHTLIIIFHNKNYTYSTKIEIILVSICYSLTYCIIHPLLKKIYGEKNTVFFGDFVLNIASNSRWIIVFISDIRNSAKVLLLVFMLISLLFISTKTFDFSSDSKRKKNEIELEEKNDDEENDKQEEDEIEDALAIVDVKSDVE
jgi:hypothetical protein